MKTILLSAIFLFLVFDLKAEIIYTDPVQNSKYVSIENNIVIGFDGAVENSDLNSLITVRGSKSGLHSGNAVLSTDRKKIIFKPHKPFYLNETVEVSIDHIRTSGIRNKKLKYSFETQLKKHKGMTGSGLSEEFGNAYGFQSGNESDTLPLLTVNISNNPTPGKLYMSNFPIMNIPNTPYLLEADNSGNILYSRQMTTTTLDYKRQPNGLLTYYSRGKFYAENDQHILLDSFVCGNGYSTDAHELLILNNGHALLMSYDRQTIDMSVIVPGGDTAAIVIGLIIQELDQNKNVVFQWRSWDHFNITDGQHIDFTAATVDYVHGNAIEMDNDGNILISSRHLDEITKIDRSTGDIIWRLGGPHNQFTFVNDPEKFCYQHNVRRIPNGNITLFDNGNYHSPSHSRAVEYQLDEVNKIATLVWQYRRTPDIWGFALGSVQRLHNGNTLISWGATNPTITEVTPAGVIALEMSLPSNIFTYRTFRDEVDLTLNAKIAIEGFYNNINDQLNMNDTVRAYVRNSVSPFGIIDSARSIVDSLNFNGNFRFYNVPTGTYFVSLKHRNALETWSKAGGESFATGGVYQYDFTNSSSNSFGNNVILKGSRYCLYSGDVNHDGVIDQVDVIAVSNDASGFVTGYVDSDVNGNNVTDLSDLLAVHANSINFIVKIVP